MNGPKWSKVGSSTNRPTGKASATASAIADGWASSTRPATTTTGMSIDASLSHVWCRPPCSNVRASCSGSHFRRRWSPSGRRPKRT